MKNRIIAAFTFGLAILYIFLVLCIPIATTAFVWTGESSYAASALTCCIWALFLTVVIALASKQ